VGNSPFFAINDYGELTISVKIWEFGKIIKVFLEREFVLLKRNIRYTREVFNH